MTHRPDTAESRGQVTGCQVLTIKVDGRLKFMGMRVVIFRCMRVVIFRFILMQHRDFAVIEYERLAITEPEWCCAGVTGDKLLVAVKQVDDDQTLFPG